MKNPALLTILLFVTILLIFIPKSSAIKYDQLTNEQKQIFWSCWKKDCQELLSQKDYNAYWECSSNCLSQATVRGTAWCSDTDNGLDFYNVGTVYTNIYPQGKKDYCYTFPNGKTYLLERVCKNNKQVYVQKDCTELDQNYVCEINACIEKTYFCSSKEDPPIPVGHTNNSSICTQRVSHYGGPSTKT